MLAKATFILTGNEIGKGEILENYSVMENKIRIVPFPITFFCYGEEEKPKFELPEKYFFYPAQFWPHKNHICIVKAVSYLRKEKNIDAHVILTGSDKGNKSYIQKMVKELGVEDLIHFAGFVSYEEMKFIYTHAAGTIFASLMGPNNIPPIEAVYLDCPLMITDIPGHVEQMGDGIMYFNGYKPNELAAHMEKLLTDASARNEALRRQLIKKKEFESYDYASGIISMLEEFELMRNTWKQ